MRDSEQHQEEFKYNFHVLHFYLFVSCVNRSQYILLVISLRGERVKPLRWGFTEVKMIFSHAERKKEVSVFLPLLAFKKKDNPDVMDWEEEREQFVIHAKQGLIKTKSSQVLTEK